MHIKPHDKPQTFLIRPPNSDAGTTCRGRGWEKGSAQDNQINHPLKIEVKHTLPLILWFNIPNEYTTKNCVINFLVCNFLNSKKYLSLNVGYDASVGLKLVFVTFISDINYIFQNHIDLLVGLDENILILVVLYQVFHQVVRHTWLSAFEEISKNTCIYYLSSRTRRME